METIINIIFLLVGFAIGRFTLKQVKQSASQIKEKLRKNEGRVLEWTPPKDEETIASEKVMKELKNK